MKLFDSHCHLQDERLKPDFDQVLCRAKDVGVVEMACCGSSEADWLHTLEISRRIPGCVPAFGIHPWYAASRSAGWKKELVDLLNAVPSAGVGEIGLDHAIKARNDDDQMSLFIEQLDIARRLHRPVSMHCRRAWEALMSALNTGPELAAGFVVHSYSGSAELVEQLSRAGAYFSFSGTITRSGNTRGHRSVQAAPIDRLLIETDAPDLMPVIDGVSATGPNEPANLMFVLNAVAELRNMTPDEIAEITRRNARRLFMCEADV